MTSRSLAKDSDNFQPRLSLTLTGPCPGNPNENATWLCALRTQRGLLHTCRSDWSQKLIFCIISTRPVEAELQHVWWCPLPSKISWYYKGLWWHRRWKRYVYVYFSCATSVSDHHQQTAKVIANIQHCISQPYSNTYASFVNF